MRCKNCGIDESRHCVLEPLPDGCECAAGCWSELDVTPICGKYRGNGTTYCEICDHDEACHKKGDAQ